MFKSCQASCGLCLIFDYDYGDDNNNENNSDGNSNSITYQYIADYELNSLKMKRHFGCVYDNYNYAMVDAIVMKATGKVLIDWIIKLIAEPLGMNDMIYCLKEQEKREETKTTKTKCYGPTNADTWSDSDLWEEWKGGVHSIKWISNALFGSGSDMKKFMSMMIGNGTTEDGIQILTKESIDLLYTPVVSSSSHDPDFRSSSCQGTTHFALGISYCEKPSPF